MNPETRECPKCEGTMEKGKHMSPKFGRWVKGKPLSTLSVLKADSKRLWAYRCNKCGLIEMWSE